MIHKAIESSITGFTPVPDSLTKKYGPVTAHVFGIIWRYSQMEDEVCRASLSRIGSDIGVTGRTIQPHIKILEEGGYIKDLTPNRRNEPHQYKDTGKIKMKMWTGMVEEVGKNFRPRSEKISVEESTTSRREENNIFTAYEENIGLIIPMISEELKEAEKEYPESWIVDGISLAVKNNKRNWRYVETILKRWKTDGKDEGKGKPETSFEDALKAAGYK